MYLFRQEVIVGTQDGVVHVLSFEVNPDGEGDSNGEGASEKDARARKETASSTPHPREEASSGAYSPSIPLMEGLALEHGGEWLVRAASLSVVDWWSKQSATSSQKI